RSRMGAGVADIALDPGVWLVALYRLGRALPRALRMPVLAARWVLQKATGVVLPLQAEIGGGLYLAHTGDVRVGPDVRIGREAGAASRVECAVLASCFAHRRGRAAGAAHAGPAARAVSRPHALRRAAFGATVARRPLVDGELVEPGDGGRARRVVRPRGARRA